MTGGPGAALAGPVTLPPLGPLGDIRDRLAAALYGPVPPPPDTISVRDQPVRGETARRLRITMTAGSRAFSADAALWLPPGARGPVPLICGLDFVGPAGMMFSDGFPLDPGAVAYSRPDYGAGERLTETLRGVSAYRWPVPMLLGAGYAVLTSCYGSWVPDSATAWRGHGLVPLLDPACGAISLWAWALMRLLDVAATLPAIDPDRLIVAGHSRLGKAALWAAAHDTRIAAVFANQSGCAGAAPAAHPVGETLAQMAERFPHWLRPGFRADDPARDGLDQHHLLSLIAPRGLYLAAAREDLWADPLGSWLALRAASARWGAAAEGTWPDAATVWEGGGPLRNGPLGFHLRPGGHDLLPHDWALVLDWLTRR